MNLISTSFANLALDVLVSMMMLSTIACLIIWLVSFRRKTSATDRFSVWQIVVLVLLIAPLGTLLLPSYPLGWFASQPLVSTGDSLTSDLPATFTNGSENASASNTLPNLIGEAVDSIPERSDSIIVPSASETTVGHSRSFTDQAEEAKIPNSIENHQASKPIATGTISSRDSLSSLLSRLPWKVIVVSVWLGVTLCLLIRFTYSCLRIQAIERNATPLQSDTVVSENPIFVSDHLPIPVTTGVRNPKIILPSEATNWEPGTLRMIVRHESAHIQRRDVAWQLLTAVIRCLYWPQPLLWLIDKRMQLVRERACDDRVIEQGEIPSEYASVLLQIAVKLSGRHQNLVGAIPVACKPIEQRLAAILEPLTPRAPGNRTARKTITLAVCLLAISCCSLRPFEQPANTIPNDNSVEDNVPETEIVVAATSQPLPSEQEETPEHEDKEFEKQVPLPSLIKGKVLDADQVPVAGAEVKISFLGRAKNSSSGLDSDTRIELIGTTDDSGRYQIDSSGHTFNGGYAGSGVVNAPGFPQVPVPYIPGAKHDTLDMPDTVFYRKRRIIGRIISADSDAVPQNCNLRLVGNSATADGITSDREAPRYFYSPVIECDETGRFETWIPRNMPVAISVFSNDHSGHQMMIPYDKEDLGEIVLQQGSILTGRVLDASHSPVAGAVVTIRSCEHLDFKQGTRDAQFRLLKYSVKTDDLGGYQLPPFRGKCLVTVSQTGNCRDGSHLKGDRKPPIIKPHIVELLGHEETDLNLVESEMVSVRGTVRWEDGTPAANIDISCRIYSELVELVSVGGTFTDKDGQFDLKVPRYTEDGKVRVAVSGDKHPENGQWYDPHVTNDLEVDSKDKRSITLKATLTDLENVNWELRPRHPLSLPAPGPFAADPKRDLHEFNALSKRFYEQFAECEKQLAEAKGEEEILGVINEHSPHELLVDEFLALEQKHRGTSVGASILCNVLGWKARHVSRSASQDEDSNLARGQAAAFKLVEDHYLQHPEADRFVALLASQRANPESRRLLTRLQTESRYTYVRTAAVFQELEQLGNMLRAREAIDHNCIDTKFWPRSSMTMIKSMDVEATSKRFETLANRITSSYADIEIRRWVRSDIGSMMAEVDKHNGGLHQTYAAKTEAKQFQMQRLAIGQPVPKINGVDGYGNEFQLDRLQGKVILVYFTSKWFTDSDDRNMLQASRELKERFGDRGFEVVSIHRDKEIINARLALENGDITWQTVWDGQFGLLAKQWGSESYPSDHYLIDHTGTINARTSHDFDLTERIEQLIQKAESEQ